MFVCHVQIIYKSIFDCLLYYKLLLTVINCYPLIYTIVYCYKLILGERHIKYNGAKGNGAFGCDGFVDGRIA